MIIPYSIIHELVLSGCKFKYISYDHKKCVEELRLKGHIIEYMNPLYYGAGRIKPSTFQVIPTDVKKKHLIWRIGKLRVVHFDNLGRISKIYIGNKRAKCFFTFQFGMEFKPVIFKSDDKYDLISQGLAIEDTI